MYKGLSLDQAPPEDIPFRFFLSAPIFGILAGLMIAFYGLDIFTSNWDFATIGLTHLITLGWLAMIMFGAMYQMIPVLVGGSVKFVPAARFVHAVFLLGVLLLVLGFACLGSAYSHLANDLFYVAGWSLAASITVFFLQVLVAVLNVSAKDRPTIPAMRISIVSLAITMVLGILFVGNFSGWWVLPFGRVSLMGTHITFGLFGWVGTLIMGVGFHMIPMFYLTPTFPIETAHRILRLHTISLVLIPLVLLTNLSELMVIVAAAPMVIGSGLFMAQIFRLIHERKRKIVDSTLRFWQSGIIFLPISVLVILVHLLYYLPFGAVSFGIFFIVGTALTLTNGMLFKIAPFIIWFHRYSNLIGIAEVPLLKDIVDDRTARKQWKLVTLSIVILGLAVVLQEDILVRTGGLLFAISSIMLQYILVKGYRLPEAELTPEQEKMMEMMSAAMQMTGKNT